MSCTAGDCFISGIIFMIPDKVNPSFIPDDLLQSWAQTAQADLNDLLQTPGITLGHLEERLEAQARKLMLPILRAAAQEKAAQQPFQCPICGGALLAEAHQRHQPAQESMRLFELIDFVHDPPAHQPKIAGVGRDFPVKSKGISFIHLDGGVSGNNMVLINSAFSYSGDKPGILPNWHLPMIEDIVKAVQAGTQPICTIESAVKTAVITDAIFRSAQSGKLETIIWQEKQSC